MMLLPPLCARCGAHLVLSRGRIVCGCGEEIPPGAREAEPSDFDTCDGSPEKGGAGCGVCDAPFMAEARALRPAS